MADAGNGSSVATARLGGSAVVALVYGAPVSRAGVMVEGEYRITVDDIGREMSVRPRVIAAARVWSSPCRVTKVCSRLALVGAGAP